MTEIQRYRNNRSSRARALSDDELRRQRAVEASLAYQRRRQADDPEWVQCRRELIREIGQRPEVKERRNKLARERSKRDPKYRVRELAAARERQRQYRARQKQKREQERE